MLNNILYWFYFLNWNRLTFEVKEVANKDRLFLLISKVCVFLESIIVSCSCCQLQSSNCLRIPSMLYSILAPMELTKSRKRSICILFASSHAFFMHCDCIVSNSFESDTSNRTCFCSEIRIEQTLRKSDALKNLCSTIATDSTDTHLCHNLEQTLLHSFDIISFSCVVVFLNLSVLYELIKYSVSHIRTQSRNSITK